MEIEKGFFAHPNVGAAVFAANMENIISEFLNDVTLDKKLFITRNEMFGPELPETGTEGQIFFLLQE